MRKRTDIAIRAGASIFRRTGSGLLFALLAVTLTAGCSRYFWNAPKSWALKGQLESVPESAPHGVLLLERNSNGIYILVDDKAAFRSVQGNTASFRLPAGRHEIQARYTATEGERAVVSGLLKTSIDLRVGQRATLGVMHTGTGIRFVRP
jgi:hypothetical protein